MVGTVLVAAACGVVIGLVSSLLGVAGGELIIPVFILLFSVDVKLAGSMSMLVGMPTIAVGMLRHFGPGSMLRAGDVWRSTILPLRAGSVVRAILGALALGLVPSQALKIGLGIILIWSAWGVFRHLPQGTPAAAPTRGVPARVLAHDPEWGLTTLTVDGQTVTVPHRPLPIRSETWLTIHDRDVTLALAVEAESSALSTLSGLVAGIEPLPKGTTARVRVAVANAGEIAVLATRRSVAALGLAKGAPGFRAVQGDVGAMTGRTAIIFGLRGHQGAPENLIRLSVPSETIASAQMISAVITNTSKRPTGPLLPFLAVP